MEKLIVFAIKSFLFFFTSLFFFLCKNEKFDRRDSVFKVTRRREIAIKFHVCCAAINLLPAFLVSFLNLFRD